MNPANMNTGAPRPRRLVIITALLVALIGLTIAPGFECSHESSDGSKTRVVL